MPDREINSQSSLVALRMEEMPALQAFLYRFPDGDKHIASFTLEMRRINDDVPPRIDPDGRHGEYIFGLRDKDAGERIFGRLSWVDVFDVASVTSTSWGRGLVGRQALSIDPPIDPDHVFVLAGFSFSERESDHHIRSIGIFPPESGGAQLEIEFQDNSPQDDNYSAAVMFHRIPRNRVRVPSPVVFTNVAGESSQPREPGVALLTGFSFRFLDDDHHLKEFGVDLSDNNVRVTFRDNDPDRRFRAEVHYVILT